MKILPSLLILILTFQISFGQEEILEGEYWETNYKGKLYIWEYKKFTKEDVIAADKQLKLLKKSTPKDEWEGKYYSETGLGESVVFLSGDLGFVKYYAYHTLDVLYYGQIVSNEDLIILNHETSPKSVDKKVKWSETFVKVKFNKRHYLVPEEIIKEFCEYVVGRSPLQTQQDIRYRIWEKITDQKKESDNLLILPGKYKHFLVYPAEGKIIKLGNRKIQRSKNWEGKIEVDGVKYFITLNVGKKDNVKKDIEFYIPELKEFATVEKVYSKTSIASIFRRFDENNKEICEDMDYETHSCFQISLKMSAKTQNRFSYF